MTVLHLSDLHFGKPHRPAVSDALVRLADDVQPTAVVVSGDLTQRAKAKEYRAAAAFLSRLSPAPLVVVPGNHDVPLYRFWERLATPYGKYRRHISQKLDSVLDVDVSGGVRFVALNSTAPRTAIVNGRISGRQLRFAAGAFGSTPPGVRRVLVLHHNLLDPEDGEPGPPPLRGTAQVLERLGEWGVDVVLSGHIHRAWPTSRRGTSLVHAGTASSSRGRGPERGLNSVNLVRVQPSETSVVAYLYSEDARRFLPGKKAARVWDGPGQKGEAAGGSGPHL